MIHFTSISFFPKRVPRKFDLFDLLEHSVDKKYYLSEKRINTLINSERHTGFGTSKTLYAPTIMAQYAKIPTDGFYILVNSNTKDGFEVAQDGDSINFGFEGSTTRRGRVGKKVSQTLDTSCSIAIAQEQPRRLIPRECARVQGDFDDMFKIDNFSDTKLYEFIGNAMDISTTQNLILKMLEHCKIVEFTEPNEPSFEMNTKEKPKGTLF